MKDLIKACAIIMFVSLCLLLASMCGCDVGYVPQYYDEIEQQELHEYPVGPYGMREGSTLAPLSLQDHTGQVVSADDMYPHTSYWIVIVGTPTCAPCKRLWERRAEIEAHVYSQTGVEAHTSYLMDPDDSIVDGVYPTTLLISLEDMIIDSRVNGSFEKFETFLDFLI